MHISLSLAIAALAPQETPAPPRPNILVVLVDDLGYSDLGCYGGEIPTPNLDRLAAGGLRYEACYNSARCCPSRASLLTGLHPHRAGVGSFATERPDERRGPAYLGHLNDECGTLAEVLGGAGYRSYMVGKWHVGLPGPVARGFDEFYGYRRGYEQDQWSPERYERLPEGRPLELEYGEGEFYATDVFTDYALEFLRQHRERDGDDPWFLYLAHSSPHFPVQAPARTTARFVETYRAGWDALRAARFERQQAFGLATAGWSLSPRSLVPVDQEDIANGYPGVPNPAWDELGAARREDLAHRMAVFAAMVHHVDEGIGRVVADLEERGELENTLVLFTSDNGSCYEWGPFGFDGPSRRGATTLHEGDALGRMGEAGTYHSIGSGWANLGNTPFRLYKHFVHEGGVASPLIAHWPRGITREPGWVRDPVHVMDFMATLAEVAGGDPSAGVGGRAVLATDGVSLVPTFDGRALAERAIHFDHQGAYGVRSGRWKAVRTKRAPAPIEWELYDLAEDRCELRDLAAVEPERLAAMVADWEAWARRVKVYPFHRPEGAGPVAGPIAGRAVTIRCRVEPPPGGASPSGVLVAHGGRTHGIAVWLDEGQLVLSVRRGGKLTELRGPDAPGGAFDLRAELTADAELVLHVGGVEVARGDAGGLVPHQPTDGLDVGRDLQSAVGSYTAPHAFAGRVLDASVEADG